MENNITHIDLEKLSRRLRLVRAKNLLAIALGDCRVVARLTCETARLRDAIRLVRAVEL
jgi:hypothetical protein